MSWVLRDYMRGRVDQWEKRKGRAEAASLGAPVPVATPAPYVDPDDVDDDDDNPARQELSRQQRRAMEREMRKRGR